MKKKIIFVAKELPSGGVERALITAFNYIPIGCYDITLVLLSKRGFLLSEVPSNVTVEEFPFTSMQRVHYEQGRVPALKYALKHFHWFYALRILWTRTLWNLAGRRASRDLGDQLSMLSDAHVFTDEYDLAISYAGGVVCSQIVLEHIKARKKVVWFHGEASTEFEKIDVYDKIYSRFDCRYTCSKTLASDLARIYHTEPLAFTPFPHAIDVQNYQNMAQNGPGFDDGYEGLRILSVGRLHEQKGFDIAIRVASRLKSEGCKFRWYIVGEGDDRPLLERSILNCGLSKDFILLGQTHNPYHYFKDCDIYVQPSRYEGYCLTLAEARAFAKSIVSTDFTGAREQLKENETGIIVPPKDEEALCRAVRMLINDEKLRTRLSVALVNDAIDTVSDVKNAWSNLLSW